MAGRGAAVWLAVSRESAYVVPFNHPRLPCAGGRACLCPVFMIRPSYAYRTPRARSLRFPADYDPTSLSPALFSPSARRMRSRLHSPRTTCLIWMAVVIRLTR